MTLHFLNDVLNDIESTIKSINTSLFASLNIESEFINRIPGSRLLISSIPGSALRQASRCQQAFSKPCLVNLISKETHLVFSISVRLICHLRSV